MYPKIKKHQRYNRIHTFIDTLTKQRLLEYGKGHLNEGIESAVKIADSKIIVIKIITEITIS